MTLRFIIIISVLSVFSGLAYAQGGTGRSETAVIRTTESGDSSRKRTSDARTQRKFVPVVRVEKPPEPARLAIVVNEGGSQLSLSRIGSEAPAESINVPSRASSLIVRNLPAGTYTVLAKKPGYHDVARTIELLEGKRRRVDIVLRPKMALLSVSSNIPDARIDIDNIGEFDSPIRKRFVTPGTYRVVVKRRGYQSRTFDITLKRPGQEQVLNVVLQPLRIDSVLDLADQNIARCNLGEASNLINDVLVLNPAHARANLLYGMTELKRGNVAANSYFLKAVEKGDSLKFPVKVLSDRTTSLIDFELILDREGIGLRGRQDASFTIPKPQVKELSGRTDHLVLKGVSDFHGRPVEHNVKIYLETRTCSGATTVPILVKLLTEWRPGTVSVPLATPR